MRKNICLCIMSALLYSCTGPPSDHRQLSYSFFQENLQNEMDYDSMVRKFGLPVKDLGRGIHIYVYPLPDSTEMWIGFTDKIIYARRMDNRGQVMETLIP